MIKTPRRTQKKSKLKDFKEPANSFVRGEIQIQAIREIKENVLKR